ncbi:MAG: adenine phosphoribosyltransferase [bacterium]|nr:adenine phosphoribosyltransferase [bacterium]
MVEEQLKSHIRDVPDFPKEGIIFKDITTLLIEPDAFKLALDSLYDSFKGEGVTKVASVEARGFIFGAPLAYMLGAGFVPLRKPGKLPYKTDKEEYKLEYGTDAIEVHIDAFEEGDKVLILDDLLATGGTALAAARLVEKSGADITTIAFVVELDFLEGRKKLEGYDVFTLLHY